MWRYRERTRSVTLSQQERRGITINQHCIALCCLPRRGWRGGPHPRGVGDHRLPMACLREGFHAQHAVGSDQVNIAVRTMSCSIRLAIGGRPVGSSGLMRPPTIRARREDDGQR